MKALRGSHRVGSLEFALSTSEKVDAKARALEAIKIGSRSYKERLPGVALEFTESY
jgi:hypothetical protein